MLLRVVWTLCSEEWWSLGVSVLECCCFSLWTRMRVNSLFTLWTLFGVDTMDVDFLTSAVQESPTLVQCPF